MGWRWEGRWRGKRLYKKKTQSRSRSINILTQMRASIHNSEPRHCYKHMTKALDSKVIIGNIKCNWRSEACYGEKSEEQQSKQTRRRTQEEVFWAHKIHLLLNISWNTFTHPALLLHGHHCVRHILKKKKKCIKWNLVEWGGGRGLNDFFPLLEIVPLHFTIF